MFPFDSFEEQTDDSLVQDPNSLTSSDTENSSAEPVTYVNWLGEVLNPGEVYQDQLGTIYRESDDYVAGTDPWLPDPVAMQEGQSQVWIYPAEEWGYSSPSADTSIDDVIDSGTTDISYEPSVDSVPDSSMSIDSTDYSYDSSSSSSSSYESDWDSSSTDWSSSSDYDSSSDW
jgi:hypothetical protein